MSSNDRHGDDLQHCRDCGAPLGPPVGYNSLGRPIRECAAGHRQAGPFVEQRAMVNGGGRE